MNAFDPLTHSQQRLLALLKLALWNTVPDKALFEKADDVVWNEVYRLSAEQGVKAIVFDGIMLLPGELHPSRSIKLTWAFNVETIERRYEQEVAIANEIASIFAKNDIKMLLFKGIGLAQYYPVPKHREFGDLDCYLFGQQEEGNRLLIQSGAMKEKFEIGKHVTGLRYKGISIENHAFFLHKDIIHKATLLEAHLLHTLDTCKPAMSQGIIDTALFPPPDFNAIYMTCHALGHFLGGPLALRHFCDWALFLKANKGTIDFTTYRQMIEESGFTKFADAFTSLTVKYLDLDSELAPPFDNNPVLEDRMIQESFKPLFVPTIEQRSIPKAVLYKIKVLKSRKWKYDMYYHPKRFSKYIWSSIISHIGHPASITNLRK